MVEFEMLMSQPEVRGVLLVKVGTTLASRADTNLAPLGETSSAVDVGNPYSHLK